MEVEPEDVDSQVLIKSLTQLNQSRLLRGQVETLKTPEWSVHLVALGEVEEVEVAEAEDPADRYVQTNWVVFVNLSVLVAFSCRR